MYLKSLELQGFKSFPDKIKLEFNKGMTAVVGPNGSGKSNIGDAVRWVLGEQSSKTLRGSKMEDVIFAGTQYRKAVGFAQVTLHIDNKDGSLPVSAEEVGITRKLYRSGESEYLINGSSVRLKDVYELFMDTGLGRDGYSIIGQGRIAEIVGAKSNERREIFEEAAGISKIRYKKSEAEKRLAAAQENILRLRDILSELESRVEPLRVQAEKAEKFLELSGRKKTLEVSVWVKKLEELKAVLTGLDEKVLINNAEYENAEEDIRRIEEAVQAGYKAMQECNVQVEAIRAEILETERSNGQLAAEIAVCENDIRHSRGAMEELRRQQDALQLSGEEIESKMLGHIQKSEEIGALLNDTQVKLEETRQALQQLSDEAGDFDRKAEQTDRTLNQLYVRRSEINFTVNSSEENLTEIQEQLRLGDAQEEQLRLSAEQLDRDYAEVADGLKKIQEKLDGESNKLSGYTKLHEAKLQKLEAARSAHTQENDRIREKQQKLRLLIDLENNMEGFAHSVKEVLRAQKNGRISGIFGSVAQLIRVDSRYSVAIETALGAALQNVVVENEETAKRCIRLLKEQNAGRATFLPITSVKGGSLSERDLQEQDGFIAPAEKLVDYDSRFSGIIASLLGRIAIAEDIDSAASIAKKYNYRFKIVTLDGQVVNAGGSFTGGSAARSAGMLTRKNEIEALQAQITGLSAELEKSKAAVARLQAEADKLSFDIEGVRDTAAQINEDKIQFQFELRRVEMLKEQSISQLETAQAQILRLRERQKEYTEKRGASQAELEQCRQEIARLEEVVAQSQNKKDSLHQKREELSAALSSLRLREVELNKDREANERSRQQLSENRQAMEERALQFRLQSEKHAGDIEERQAQIAEKKARQDQSAEAIQARQEEILSQQARHRELERQSTEKRGELQQINNQKEQVSRELSRLQERRFSVQKDYDSIISELWEQYQMTRSDAMGLAVSLEDMPDAQRELNDLKAKIRGLGTVNVAAVEEYKEVSGRYRFMSGQLEDVELSKRDLEKLITDLTDTMRRQFSESFEQISRNFSAVFTELFGGGSGELALTNPEDVLESGVEINVAPPGKVIRNLSLLSGGEQAFVAIAIYFAILRVKPAPFCILDEIEAALDDVNVAKYAAYLRNFTDTTQFILITHRRGTMDEADVLYGVTMQEKGISRLLKMEQPAHAAHMD